VVYEDSANSYKASVMKLSDPILSGTPSHSDIDVDIINLTLSDSFTTVDYTFNIIVEAILTLEPIADVSKVENSSDFTIELNATDKHDNPITHFPHTKFLN